MMITYKSRVLTRAEVWYDNEADNRVSVDWIQYQQRSRPVPGTKTNFYYTYVIDLTLSQEQLQANLNKDTAYKIRRARDRDNFVCEVYNPRDPVVMDQFEQMFNTFAWLKGRSPLNRIRMDKMAETGVLDLSAAKDPKGNIVVYHANYYESHRATSLELPSLYRKSSTNSERNAISRANRYLTWFNMLRYQQQGLKCFDFGGWYPGSSDQERLDINRFKEGFGGKVLREYQCEKALTFKAKVVLTAANLLNSSRKFLKTSPTPKWGGTGSVLSPAMEAQATAQPGATT